MAEKQPNYLTAEAVKNFWLFGMVLLSGASLYFGVSSKVDSTNQAVENLTSEVKDLKEISRGMAQVVNDHEAKIAVITDRVNACYNYCVAPGTGRPISQGETTKTLASNDTQSFTPANTNVSVKSESKSQSEEPKDPVPAPEAPKDEPQEDGIRVKLPLLNAEIKIP